MNEDEGAYKLHQIYDHIIGKRQLRSLGTSWKPKRWCCQNLLTPQITEWPRFLTRIENVMSDSWIWIEDFHIIDFTEQSWWIYFEAYSFHVALYHAGVLCQNSFTSYSSCSCKKESWILILDADPEQSNFSQNLSVLLHGAVRSPIRIITEKLGESGFVEWAKIMLYRGNMKQVL